MELILIRGLPGSGKSTLARQLLVNAWAHHYEADQYFMQSGTYQFNADLLGAAHRWCLESARRWLAGEGTESRRVIVSNTFTTRRELRPYFDMARDLGIVPTVIVCQNQWGNTHDVPEETLKRMQERFCWDISDLFV